MLQSARRVSIIAATLAVSACANEAAAPDIAVRITNPAEGSTVSGTAAHITLGVSGIELAPAAEARPGTAHHHLYLDVDFPGAETAIPMGLPGVVHLGQAQTEFHWDSLAPGQHRIIAVLADPAHVPIRPWVDRTVTFNRVGPGDTTKKK
jgi:hypothetical protein